MSPELRGGGAEGILQKGTQDNSGPRWGTAQAWSQQQGQDKGIPVGAQGCS